MALGLLELRTSGAIDLKASKKKTSTKNRCNEARFGGARYEGIKFPLGPDAGAERDTGQLRNLCENAIKKKKKSLLVRSSVMHGVRCNYQTPGELGSQ